MFLLVVHVLAQECVDVCLVIFNTVLLHVAENKQYENGNYQCIDHSCRAVVFMRLLNSRLCRSILAFDCCCFSQFTSSHALLYFFARYTLLSSGSGSDRSLFQACTTQTSWDTGWDSCHSVGGGSGSASCSSSPSSLVLRIQPAVVRNIGRNFYSVCSNNSRGAFFFDCSLTVNFCFSSIFQMVLCVGNSLLSQV